MVMMLRRVESEMSTQKLVSWVLAARLSYNLVRKELSTTRTPKSQLEMMVPSSWVWAMRSTISSAWPASCASMRWLYRGSSSWVDKNQYIPSSKRQMKDKNSISWARMPGEGRRCCFIPRPRYRRASGSNL